MDSVLTSPLLTFSIILSITALFFLLNRRRRCVEAPEAPGGWPILGHLPLLSGSELPHKILGAMADKYGPIFTIRTGKHRVVVVSDWRIAKEVYTTNDMALASRPPSTAAHLLGYNNVMFGFAPYGPAYRDARKIVMSELLSGRRLELLKDVRDTEIETSIKDLYKLCVSQNKVAGAAKVEMKQWFNDLSLNIILRMIAGKRYFGNISNSADSESRRCQKALRDFMRLGGTYLVEDVLPCLGWVDLLGYKKEMKKTAKELDLLVQGWLDEHHKKRLVSGEANRELDFMDVMISTLEDSNFSNRDSIIKATCLSILAGSDTTMVTLTWILSLLLNNKEVLKKAQDELDRHIGRKRCVRESDIRNLVYLQAIVKETLRLYPAAPLSGPRATIEDCTLAGYHCRAGTHLTVNIWKIQRDPSVWSDPSEFLPERFLADQVDMDVKGQNFEFMPFGGGRRICPGVAFALQVLPLVMAQLLHGFDLTTEVDKPVDMTETAGLTNVKATPLEVLIKPRLHTEMSVFKIEVLLAVFKRRKPANKTSTLSLFPHIFRSTKPSTLSLFLPSHLTLSLTVAWIAPRRPPPYLLPHLMSLSRSLASPAIPLKALPPKSDSSHPQQLRLPHSQPTDTHYSQIMKPYRFSHIASSLVRRRHVFYFSRALSTSLEPPFPRQQTTLLSRRHLFDLRHSPQIGMLQRVLLLDIEL